MVEYIKDARGFPAFCRGCLIMKLTVVEGDLLAQDTEVIVNAWNRNVLPWWLLLPQGVSGALKFRAGPAPFRELARKGFIPAGGAVVTGAGRLPYKAIIHVAGINLLWLTSERIIRDCVRGALGLAAAGGWRSVAFPLVGSGTGGFPADRALAIMLDEAGRCSFDGEVRLVKFKSPLNARGCYCDLREKDPAFFASRGIPPGHCGICETCGKPGHTRHFPGAAPYTGAWCDYHYRRLSLLHPLGTFGAPFYACLAIAAWFLARTLLR